MPTDPAVPDGKDEADIAAMTSSGGRLGGRRRLRRAQEAGVAGASRESPSRRSLQGGPAGGERASASKGEGRRRRAVQDDDADDGDNAYVPEDAEEEAEIEPQTPVRRPRKREAAANAERTPKRAPSSGRRVGRGHGEPAVGVEERHDGNDDDDGVEVDDLPSTARRPSRAETYRNYLQHQMEVDSPPLRGKKPPPPTGAPDCLAGLNFCITGVMDSLTRTEMEDLVRAHGGHIAKSVTRNLQYLVAGADPGPRKMEEARKRSAVEVVDEDGVFALIRRRSAAASTPARRLSMGETSPPPPPPPPYNASKARKPPSPPRPRTTAGQRAATAATIGAPARTSELWTVKYRPRVPEDLIANPGVLKQLSDWLDQWRQVYGDGAAAKTKSSVPRAALLAGPPGLGKSSAAHVVVRHKGLEPIEFNASDTRSKSALQTHVTELIRSHNIDRYAVATLARNASDTGASASQARSVTRAHLCGNRGHVLIMDEVDGMSAGDRGGMAELNKLIKTSRVPIIAGRDLQRRRAPNDHPAAVVSRQSAVTPHVHGREGGDGRFRQDIRGAVHLPGVLGVLSLARAASAGPDAAGGSGTGGQRAGGGALAAHLVGDAGRVLHGSGSDATDDPGELPAVCQRQAQFAQCPVHPVVRESSGAGALRQRPAERVDTAPRPLGPEQRVGAVRGGAAGSLHGRAADGGAGEFPVVVGQEQHHHQERPPAGGTGIARQGGALSRRRARLRGDSPGTAPGLSADAVRCADTAVAAAGSGRRRDGLRTAGRVLLVVGRLAHGHLGRAAAGGAPRRTCASGGGECRGQVGAHPLLPTTVASGEHHERGACRRIGRCAGTGRPGPIGGRRRRGAGR
eukprot:ctg_1111.g340